MTRCNKVCCIKADHYAGLLAHLATDDTIVLDAPRGLHTLTRALLAEAWLQGADHMAAQEGIAPDYDLNPYRDDK